MPSSVMFGSRPRMCLTRAYSSAVSPCSAAISGVTLISVDAVAMPESRIRGAQHAAPLQENLSLSLSLLVSRGRPCRADQGFHHRTENNHAVRGIECRLHRALRMRHQTGNVALA